MPVAGEQIGRNPHRLNLRRVMERTEHVAIAEHQLNFHVVFARMEHSGNVCGIAEHDRPRLSAVYAHLREHISARKPKRRLIAARMDFRFHRHAAAEERIAAFRKRVQAHLLLRTLDREFRLCNQRIALVGRKSGRVHAEIAAEINRLDVRAIAQAVDQALRAVGMLIIHTVEHVVNQLRLIIVNFKYQFVAPDANLLQHVRGQERRIKRIALAEFELFAVQHHGGLPHVLAFHAQAFGLFAHFERVLQPDLAVRLSAQQPIGRRHHRQHFGILFAVIGNRHGIERERILVRRNDLGAQIKLRPVRLFGGRVRALCHVV